MRLPIVDPRSPLALLATRPAVKAEEQATLGQAAALMELEHVSAVLVGAPPSGVLTEHDLARALAGQHGPDDALAPFVSRPIVSFPAETPIVEAAALMLNQEIRHVIVDLPGGEQAIVSLRSVMAALLQAVDPRLWLSSLRISVATGTRR